MKIELRV